MNSILSSRARAGMLLVAFALVGGTGCITTTMVASHVRDQRIRNEAEGARQRRIAELTPRIEAGEAAPAVEMAQLLLAAREPRENDPKRALALLDRAAAQGDGPAQALLGKIVMWGRYWPESTAPVPPNLGNSTRGLALLMQAATQACSFRAYRGHAFDITREVADYYQRRGPEEQEKLWRARRLLHCGAKYEASSLARNIQRGALSPREQASAYAQLLLIDSHADIDAAKVHMTPDAVAAGEHEASALRALVAQSEQQYPRPTRKDMP